MFEVEDEDEDYPDVEEVQSLNLFQDEVFTEETNLTPKIFFKPTDTPKIYTESAQITAPVTKNGNFTYAVDDKLVRIFKGMQRNSPSPQKIDMRSKDAYFNTILSHANTKANAQDIPENCFRIATSARPALSAAYRVLARQQMLLKNLIIHAQRNLTEFNNENTKEVEELIKVYFHPIEAQVENVHDSIRKIRALSLPKFIPATLKKTIVTAPILAEKIWNIPSTIQNKIQAARADFNRRTYPRSSGLTRESRPFQSRGRFQDRRARPQRRGGYFKRRSEYKSENKNNSYRNDQRS